ncbi:MAG TPA: hypothetical protein VGS22_02770 [Thermoanaerobaculia bacterium]|jgi:hypothetical protein|nr:hypothetical protein [Thermoanaerobaculia bacterium]
MTKIKQLLPILALAGLLASPALATDFGLYGTYWDTDALNSTAGGGAKLGFGEGLVRFEVRASHFPDLSENVNELIDNGTGRFKVRATVPEAGITFNFAPEQRFQPYLGAGASYYILDTNQFEVDDEIGWYGLVGFHVGRPEGGPAFFAEGMYRKVDATIVNDDATDPDVNGKVDFDLSGPAVNAGVLFRF